MKHKKVVEIVEDHFQELEKLFSKILKRYNEDNVHDFRVTVKKLRAFLKLAGIKKKADKPFIPKLLKTFYGHIGSLRNIHLQKRIIFKYTTDNKRARPKSYIQLLTNEENYWKKEAAALMKETSIEDVKDKILKELPGKINKNKIKKFTAKSLAELKELLCDVKDDETIHSIRKILKNILYTYSLIKDETDLPKLISGRKKLKTITGLLGDYVDKYIELKYMKPEYFDKVKVQTEKKLLLQMQASCRQEKQVLKQRLYYHFKTLKKQLNT